MSTVKRTVYIDLIKATKKAQNLGVLAVAKIGAGKAKSLAPVDTGALRGSITDEPISRGMARYGTNIEYASYVEFGARGKAPHPFLRMSADILKNQASRIFARVLKGSLRNG